MSLSPRRAAAPVPPPPALEALQQQLGHRFADPALLRRALTHKSFGADHNERLEFLGDAVLAAAVSRLLYRQFPQAPEGDLSRVRAHLVREDTLHHLALQLGLPALLRLSEGEARNGGAQRPSILADAMEALIGALLLDAGLEPAVERVEALFMSRVASTAAEAWTKDPKTELQEWLQARREPVPAYEIAETRGQDHDQTFVVRCSVPTRGLSLLGEGRSRRAAEQAAARLVLAQLKPEGGGLPPPGPASTPIARARR